MRFFGFLLLSCIVWGQATPPPLIPKLQNQTIWGESERLIQISKGNASRKGREIKIYQIGEKPVEIKPPDNIQALSWCNGRFFALQSSIKITKDGPGYEYFRLVASEDGKNFQTIGEFANKKTSLPYDFILPLGRKNYYIAGNVIMGFTKENKKSFVGIFKSNEKGIITLEDVVDLSLDRPIFRSFSPGSETSYVETSPEYTSLNPFFANLVQTPKFFLFLSARSGIVWVIDRNNGNVKRTQRIYSVEDKELGSNSRLEDPILAAQPESNGKVLIAARTEAAFRLSAFAYAYRTRDNAITISESRSAQDKKDDMPGAFRKSEAEAALRANPDIVWWEYDPEHGTLERTSPLNAPNQLKSILELRQFKLEINLDNSVTTNITNHSK